MGKAEQSIQHVCGLAEIKQVRDWEKCPLELKPHYKTLLPENLGTHCLEWPARKVNAEVQMLVKANSKPYDIEDLHERLSHNGQVWLEVRGQAGWKDCTRRQWSPQSHDLQPDHGGRNSHTCNTVASLPA